ncbi:MAG: site-specific integrase [Oscillospiraceae bacterium]|nr:site-specific integrase [Oscillospiraceae bacterium]
MPRYEVRNKNGKLVKNKDGLQKYRVFVSFTCESTGEHKKLSQIVYGSEESKTVERYMEQQIQRGEHVQGKMTVQQLYDEYMETKKGSARESTLDTNRRDYRLHIKEMFAGVYIDKITLKMLQDWKTYMQGKTSMKGKNKLSLKSKQHAYGMFRAMLNYAVKMEYIEKNHLITLGTFKDVNHRKTKAKFYTAEEFKKFISVAKEHAEEHEIKHKHLGEWEYYVFFSILFLTGLRKGECHGLRWSDIDGEYLNVERSIMQKLKGGDVESKPKTESSERTLQLPKALICILDAHKKRKQRLHTFSEEDFICSGVDGRSLRDGTIQSRNKQFAELAGLDKIKIHEFRHSHVSVLANERVIIQEVARRLGHSNIKETLNTYSHLYPREEERAVEILDSIM